MGRRYRLCNGVRRDLSEMRCGQFDILGGGHATSSVDGAKAAIRLGADDVVI